MGVRRRPLTNRMCAGTSPRPAAFTKFSENSIEQGRVDAVVLRSEPAFCRFWPLLQGGNVRGYIRPIFSPRLVSALAQRYRNEAAV